MKSSPTYALKSAMLPLVLRAHAAFFASLPASDPKAARLSLGIFSMASRVGSQPMASQTSFAASSAWAASRHCATADGLWMTAPASSPFVYGEAITSTRWVPPADWPKAVILSGSPPKAAMLALTHRRPSRISRLPLPESPPLSLRKPSTFTR